MAPYKEAYPVGTPVCIKDAEALRIFKVNWRYHHELQAEQLEYAGRTSVVETVGFYHGGDVLYELRGVPGIWHEECLTRAE